MTSLGTTSHIAEAYSKALFELASQQQLIDTVKNDLDILGNLVTADKNFLAFMTSPTFSFEQKQQLIEKSCGSSLNNLTSDFLMVVISHNRITFLPYIIAKYEKLYQNYHNYCNIRVTVSQPLSPEGKEDLKTVLSVAMNNDSILLDTTVEPSIIGGIIIHYGDMVIDNSVSGRLKRAVDTIITRCKNRGKVYET
jgi:F-type H+-transporting ATPase subunit delta